MEKTDKVTIPRILKMKKEGKKIAALTAYDATMAAIEDEAGMDIILVGDSAGMVIAGDADTISISLDEMVYMTKWVRKGVKRALLVGDMPFGSYQASSEQAVESAIRFMKEARAEAVKLEGGRAHTGTIEKMTAYGIPVMGHLGLTPQSVNLFGGYPLRGKSRDEADRIFEDAQLLEQAGVFAIVLEKITVELAQKISETLSIPTIGIASGPYCDGQILVAHDMLGLGPKFKFARRYLQGANVLRDAFEQYIQDIRSSDFPTEKESFHA